jgi:hypothetical protein
MTKTIGIEIDESSENNTFERVHIAGQEIGIENSGHGNTFELAVIEDCEVGVRNSGSRNTYRDLTVTNGPLDKALGALTPGDRDRLRRELQGASTEDAVSAALGMHRSVWRVVERCIVAGGSLAAIAQLVLSFLTR